MASASSPEGHVQPLLGAYVLGGLTASQAAAVRAHLERCARCRAEHDWLAVVPSWLDLLTAEDEADSAEGIQGQPPPTLPGEGS
jgi:anti-sigma factor RsiW